MISATFTFSRGDLFKEVTSGRIRAAFVVLADDRIHI